MNNLNKNFKQNDIYSLYKDELINTAIKFLNDIKDLKDITNYYKLSKKSSKLYKFEILDGILRYGFDMNYYHGEFLKSDVIAFSSLTINSKYNLKLMDTFDIKHNKIDDEMPLQYTYTLNHLYLSNIFNKNLYVVDKLVLDKEVYNESFNRTCDVIYREISNILLPLFDEKILENETLVNFNTIRTKKLLPFDVCFYFYNIHINNDELYDVIETRLNNAFSSLEMDLYMFFNAFKFKSFDKILYILSDYKTQMHDSIFENKFYTLVDNLEFDINRILMKELINNNYIKDIGFGYKIIDPNKIDASAIESIKDIYFRYKHNDIKCIDLLLKNEFDINNKIINISKNRNIIVYDKNSSKFDYILPTISFFSLKDNTVGIVYRTIYKDSKKYTISQFISTENNDFTENLNTTLTELSKKYNIMIDNLDLVFRQNYSIKRFTILPKNIYEYNRLIRSRKNDMVNKIFDAFNKYYTHISVIYDSADLYRYYKNYKGTILIINNKYIFYFCNKKFYNYIKIEGLLKNYIRNDYKEYLCFDNPLSLYKIEKYLLNNNFKKLIFRNLTNDIVSREYFRLNKNLNGKIQLTRI